jgi:DUF1680 family protein
MDKVLKKGYARIRREWHPGDTVELELAMPVERITSHPMVKATLGRVALMRGPLVYCVEGADVTEVPLDRIGLPREGTFKVVMKKDLLNGVTILKGQGQLIEDKQWKGKLYRAGSARTRKVPLTLVPYCVWGNRGPGSMRIWMRSV